MAIYGKPFIPAARQTWTMIKDRGIEAMINDNLIGNVLFMGKRRVDLPSNIWVSNRTLSLQVAYSLVYFVVCSDLLNWKFRSLVTTRMVI